MSAGFFNNLFDYGMGGILRKPIKDATGLSDAQLAGAAALAVAAPYALPALGSGGAVAGSGLIAGGAGATGSGLTLGGTGATGSGMVAGSGATLGAPAAASPGLLSQFSSIAGPASQGLGIANQVSQLNHTQPIQGGQLPQRQGPDFTGLLNAQSQQDAQLRQQRQARMQSLLGGNYGSA